MHGLRFFGLMLGLSLLLAACMSSPSARTAEPVVVGGLAYRSMPWQVKVAMLPAGLDALALQTELQKILDDADAVLSTWQPDTELMRFNRAPIGSWVPVSPLLLHAVQTAVAVSVLSDGAYDVTIGPLVGLWGFGRKPFEGVPDAAAIAAARQRVGWRHIGIDAAGSRLMRRADIQVDLSSIGEGIAVDALADFLERRQVRDYLVSVAGTLRVRGHKPDGGSWQVAVEQPDGSGLPRRRLALEAQAVSTSGAYRNYRDGDGHRYSHTIDPKTGWPITHGGVSVTVVTATDAATADALATAFNVLGPEAGLELAGKEKLAVFYIKAAGRGFSEAASPSFVSFLFPER